MAGGRIYATLNVRLLNAFFDAFLGLLINFQPFHFSAQGGVSVGTGFTLDLWIVNIHISVEISAMLYVEGLSLGGRAHVDFWVFGFEINFGADSSRPSRLDLTAFWDLIMKTKRAKSKSLLDAGEPHVEDDPPPKPNVITCESVMEPDGENKKETPQGKPWVV